MCSQFKKGCFWHRSDDVKLYFVVHFFKRTSMWLVRVQSFRGKNLKLRRLTYVFFFPFSCLVKLWSTDMEHSVACLEAKANVCCVKFNPESRYHLSFGSAGRQVYLWTGFTLESTTVKIWGIKSPLNWRWNCLLSLQITAFIIMIYGTKLSQ